MSGNRKFPGRVGPAERQDPRPLHPLVYIVLSVLVLASLVAIVVVIL